MQEAYTVGILRQIVHRIGPAHIGHVELQQEQFGIGMRQNIIQNGLPLDLHEISRMVVISELQAIFGGEFAHTVAVVAAGGNLLQRRTEGIARHDTVLGTHRTQGIEQHTPTLHYGLLVCGVVLYRGVGRGYRQPHLVAQGLEIGGRHAETVRVAVAVERLHTRISYVGKTLQRRLDITHILMQRIELNPDTLLLGGTSAASRYGTHTRNER